MIQRKPRGRQERTPAHRLEPLRLPRPTHRLGRSAARALQLRRTTRAMSDKRVPLQTLSDLLWAACGVNRRKGPFGMPGRTAASASNSQEIDVYVALEAGTYRYDP